MHIFHKWTVKKVGIWRLDECHKCKRRRVVEMYPNLHAPFPKWWIDGRDSAPHVSSTTPRG